VDRDHLTRHTPFELDLYRGRAFVSLVAFSMRRFRLRGSGVVGSLAFALVARHRLLNLRTYVRYRGERGICFLAEWINNPISVFLGPRLFGLPYRYGRLIYRHDLNAGCVRGEVKSGNRTYRLRYRAELDPSTTFAPVHAGSLDEFLLERYTAFTANRGRRGLFRIWHRPWTQTPISVVIDEKSLLSAVEHWLPNARLVAAHYSPGVKNVWIGRPRTIRENVGAANVYEDYRGDGPSFDPVATMDE
jgi:hypothetical protein